MMFSFTLALNFDFQYYCHLLQCRMCVNIDENLLTHYSSPESIHSLYQHWQLCVLDHSCSRKGSGSTCLLLGLVCCTWRNVFRVHLYLSCVGIQFLLRAGCNTLAYSHCGLLITLPSTQRPSGPSVSLTAGNNAAAITVGRYLCQSLLSVLCFCSWSETLSHLLGSGFMH